MPWAEREHVCVDCGETYRTSANNKKRCNGCARERELERKRAAYRNRRGESFGKRPRQHAPMSEETRFNMMMAKSFKQAKCKKCGRHMMRCECCKPRVRTATVETAATWKPWELPIPKG